jgi:hypothetical protein
MENSWIQIAADRTIVDVEDPDHLVFSLFQGSSCAGTSFWLEWRPEGYQAG